MPSSPLGVYKPLLKRIHFSTVKLKMRMNLAVPDWVWIFDTLACTGTCTNHTATLTLYTWLFLEWECESFLYQCKWSERPQATRLVHSHEGVGEEEVHLCGVALGYACYSKQSWLDVHTLYLNLEFYNFYWKFIGKLMMKMKVVVMMEKSLKMENNHHQNQTQMMRAKGMLLHMVSPYVWHTCMYLQSTNSEGIWALVCWSE